MLQNWVVKTQSTKRGEGGLNTRASYLLSQDRASHKNTEIVPLVDVHRRVANILNEVEIAKQQRKKAGLRGGGLASLATEFTLDLPTGVGGFPDPTNDEWKKIYLDVMESMAKQLNQKRVKELVKTDVDILDEAGNPTGEKKMKNKTVGWEEETENPITAKQLHKITMPVIHREKPPKKSHMHIVVGKTLNGRVLVELERKAVTRALKIALNASVLKHLGVDNKTYTPEGPRGKNKHITIARDDNAQKALAEIAIKEQLAKKQIKRAAEITAEADARVKSAAGKVEALETLQKALSSSILDKFKDLAEKLGKYARSVIREEKEQLVKNQAIDAAKHLSEIEPAKAQEEATDVAFEIDKLVESDVLTKEVKERKKRRRKPR